MIQIHRLLRFLMLLCALGAVANPAFASRAFVAANNNRIYATGNPGALDITDSTWSIGFWVKFSSVGTEQWLVSRWYGQFQYRIFLHPDRTIWCQIYSGGLDFQTVISATTFAPGTWHHVACVQDGTGANSLRLYIDGALDASASTDAAPQAIDPWQAIFNIGARGDESSHDLPLDGKISRVGVWSTAISPTYITNLQTQSPNDCCSTGLAFYTIDTPTRSWTMRAARRWSMTAPRIAAMSRSQRVVAEAPGAVRHRRRIRVRW
jgi:Concanavalin A-like lectin/glucanases superfamily